MQVLTKEIKRNAFRKLGRIKTFDKFVWRKDSNNVKICYSSYMDYNSKYGWGFIHLNGDITDFSAKNIIAMNLRAVDSIADEISPLSIMSLDLKKHFKVNKGNSNTPVFGVLIDLKNNTFTNGQNKSGFKVKKNKHHIEQVLLDGLVNRKDVNDMELWVSTTPCEHCAKVIKRCKFIKKIVVLFKNKKVVNPKYLDDFRFSIFKATNANQSSQIRRIKEEWERFQKNH